MNQIHHITQSHASLPTATTIMEGALAMAFIFMFIAIVAGGVKAVIKRRKPQK